MRTPKKITRAWLERREACETQVEIFAKEWPDGAELTRANLVRAGELCLEEDWAAANLLSAQKFAAWEERDIALFDTYLDGDLTPRRRKNYNVRTFNTIADTLGLA